MNEPRDASLVDASLAGDAEAFGALVRRHQECAYGVALGVLADFSLALDATQEALLCAYCDLAALRDPERFRSWLCGIARNTALEICRDRRRQERLARTAAEQHAQDAAPSPEHLAAGAEERRLVQASLARVNEKDREALTLYYADGLSYADICDCLEISEGTLKGRMQRGRAALRKELVMVEQLCKDNAPDEEFAQQLDEAVRTLSAAGPDGNHIPSAWLTSVVRQLNRLAASGDQGFRVSLALSHAGSARLRGYAATALGLRPEDRALEELRRMLDDRAGRVRRRALKWYASRIHPDPAVTGPHAVSRPADTVPAGVDAVARCAADTDPRVRLGVVAVLSAYAACDNPQVATTLRQILDDPKHKVRHAAARVLGVPCPGCGHAD